MPETTTETRAEKEAQERTRYREQQASIVLGLRTILDEDEQLLGFARGRISGGWRGKLAVGPEAFFAPYVNIGLTERRLFLQHIHPEDGKPSEIPPHTFVLADVDSITFSGIETFGKDEEGRMTIRQTDDQYFRIRLAGGNNTQDANALVEVFRSLTKSRREPKSTPTQRVCGCGKETFDREYKFCPYCGLKQLGMQAEPAPPPAYTPPPTPRSPEPPPAPTTQTFTFSPAENAAKTPPPPPMEPPPFGPSGAFGLAAFASVPSPPAPVDVPMLPAPPELPMIPPEMYDELEDERGAVAPELPGDSTITEEAAPIPVTSEEAQAAIAEETPQPTPPEPQPNPVPDAATEGHEPATPPNDNKNAEGWL